MSTFRAFWPVIDPEIPLHHLVASAMDDLPWLTAQAHAVLTGPGRWQIEESWKVPGSGRVTPLVLLYEAPASEGRSPFLDSREEEVA